MESGMESGLPACRRCQDLESGLACAVPRPGKGHLCLAGACHGGCAAGSVTLSRELASSPADKWKSDVVLCYFHYEDF
jgi:hypothetical protein